MDGIHDLGGKQGFGPVQTNDCLPDNRAGFAQAWEAKVFAILRALPQAGALQNSDQFRHAVERIVPGAYLTHGYYGRWLGGLETLLAEAGVVTLAEIDARSGNFASAAQPSAQPVRVPASTQGGGPQRSLTQAPRFALGATVRTASHGAAGHTRLPGYARGCCGVITALHDAWVLPDTNAMGLGEQPCHLYTVTFAGTELWGDTAEPNMALHLDLFEPYLTACETEAIHLANSGAAIGANNE